MSKPKQKKISGASLRNAFEEIIWPRRRLIFLGLVLILFNRLAGLALPAATRPLIDDVIPTGDSNQLMFLLGGVGFGWFGHSDILSFVFWPEGHSDADTVFPKSKQYDYR